MTAGQTGEGGFPPPLLQQAEEILRLAREQKVLIGCAESCTGGLVAGCLSEIAGASDVFVCGFVTYSNEAKERLLGVPGTLLEEVGAVSEEVAVSMAENTLERGGVDLSVSITGIAGPGGGSVEKPVGLVHFASAYRKGASVYRQHRERHFKDMERHGVRMASVAQALELLRENLLKT